MQIYQGEKTKKSKYFMQKFAYVKKKQYICAVFYFGKL